MRCWIIVPLLLAAACSGEAPAPKQEEAPAADKLASGQWELTSEVTQFAKADQGTPKIDTPVGTRATFTACIAEADTKKPQPQIFSAEKDECSYGNYYMSGGRISATVNCERPGLSGNVATNVDGSFTDQTMEATLRTDTYLTTDGDVRFTRKLVGRRIGQCTPEAAPKQS